MDNFKFYVQQEGLPIGFAQSSSLIYIREEYPIFTSKMVRACLSEKGIDDNIKCSINPNNFTMVFNSNPNSRLKWINDQPGDNYIEIDTECTRKMIFHIKRQMSIYKNEYGEIQEDNKIGLIVINNINEYTEFMTDTEVRTFVGELTSITIDANCVTVILFNPKGIGPMMPLIDMHLQKYSSMIIERKLNSIKFKDTRYAKKPKRYNLLRAKLTGYCFV